MKRTRVFGTVNGAKIGEIRRAAGMSRTELAKRMGVSLATVANYESNISCPSKENLEKLCLVLQIKEDDIKIHDVGYSFTTGMSNIVNNTRGRKGFKRYYTPTETEAWIVSHNKLNGADTKEEINLALKNSFGIGSKKYILIDPALLHVPAWQRDTDMAKVTEIAENFNEDKFDPIKAYIDDNGKLVLADGAHRALAFLKRGERKILVELLNSKEHEAILTFLTQQSGRKTMTVADTYRAGVKANIEDYLRFKEIFESYGIQITAEEAKQKDAIGTVRPSGTMLRLCKSQPDMLKKVLDLLIKLEWNGSEANVFTLRNIQVTKKLLLNVPNAEDKLLRRCKGATFYESKVLPVKSNAQLYDFLSAELK